MEGNWRERVRKETRRRLNLLLRKYERDIYRFIYWKVGDMEQARDITAKVFLRGYFGIKNFKGESLKFWLMRIAENAVYDFYRREKKRKRRRLRKILKHQRE